MKINPVVPWPYAFLLFPPPLSSQLTVSLEQLFFCLECFIVNELSHWLKDFHFNDSCCNVFYMLHLLYPHRYFPKHPSVFHFLSLPFLPQIFYTSSQHTSTVECDAYG